MESEWCVCVECVNGRDPGGEARALAGTLFMEAFTCWNFWANNQFRPDHARSHFVTNMVRRVFDASRNSFFFRTPRGSKRRLVFEQSEQ